MKQEKTTDEVDALIARLDGLFKAKREALDSKQTEQVCPDDASTNPLALVEQHE